MASAGRATRSSASKRRIPLGLLPYSSSESEEEEDGSEAPDVAQLGGLMMRQRAAANSCASAANQNENEMASEPTLDKRRKVAGSPRKCNSSPLRASPRARQSPAREGMVVTQKGSSCAISGCAQGKLPAAARPMSIADSTGEEEPCARAASAAGLKGEEVSIDNSVSEQKQCAPATSAASANGEELSRALRLDSTVGSDTVGVTPATDGSDTAPGTPGSARSGPGPQTPVGAPPAPGLAMTDSRLPAPCQSPSGKPCPPSAMKIRRASESVAGRTARASVRWRDDVVSPPASRVRLHKEARRQSEDMLADAEASDLGDLFSAAASEPSKPPSPAQTRRRASEKAAYGQARSSGCTDRKA